jgi:hypothetical protein
MATQLRDSWRVIPAREGLAIVLILSVSGLAFIAWYTVFQGTDVPPPLLFVIAGLLLLMAQSISQLLPGSPGDFLEVGPDGLTIGGPFGRRHRRWNEIERFSVSLLPTRALPFVWVTAVSTKDSTNMGFSMGGYMKLRWSDDIGEQREDLRDWFENLRAVYTKGNHSGTFPRPPKRFIGHLIERYSHGA